MSTTSSTKIQWSESSYAYLALRVLENDKKKRLQQETMRKIEEKKKEKSKEELLHQYMLQNVKPENKIVKLERKEPTKKRKKI